MFGKKKLAGKLFSCSIEGHAQQAAYNITMAVQQGITSFFSPSSAKRSARDAGLSISPPQNKSSRNDAVISNLSPEQKERMEQKRAEAEKKLLDRKVPPYFGESWKRALAAEFGKEYFKKVCTVHCCDWKSALTAQTLSVVSFHS